MSPASSAPAKSIALQLGVFTSLLLVVTGAAMSFCGYGIARQMVRSQIHDRLRLVAVDRSQMVREYVDRQEERVALVASRTRLRDLIDQYRHGDMLTDEMRRRTGQILGDARTSTRDFQAISFVSVEGRVLTSTETQSLDKDLSQHPSVRHCLEANSPTAYHLSEPFIQDGELVAHLAAPAYARAGDLLGVVLVRFHVEPLRTLLRAELPDQGASAAAQVLIGRREGEHVRYLLPAPDGTVRRDAADQVRSMLAAIDGARGFALTTYAGERVLLYHIPVTVQPGYEDWGLVAKLNLADAYAPLARLRSTLLLTQLALLCVGLFAAGVLANRWTRPIVHLRDTAHSFAEGNWEARVAIERSDEIGALAATFNQMAASLSALNKDLESQVQSRTQDLEAARDAAEAARAQLSVRTRELERSNQDLQQFAYVASHDLKEPLRAVTGFTELLQKQYADQLDEQAQSFIGYAVDGARRMRSMIDSLLEYSRVGTSELSWEKVPLADVVDYALANLRTSIEETGAAIDVRELPTLTVDKLQLARVFQNLIGNALKFKAPGHAPQIAISAERAEEGWQILVEDDGIGVKKEHAERIFLIFQRLHPREQYGGTGIGLAVCERIVRRHGGRIWVDAEEGRGCRFYFTLPADPPGDAAQQRTAESASQLRRSRQSLPASKMDEESL